MLGYKKPAVQQDPVEAAKQDVAGILSYFSAAQATIIGATATLTDRKETNEALIQSLVGQNSDLVSEINRFQTVANKLAEFSIDTTTSLT
jgi:hypothetical protein